MGLDNDDIKQLIAILQRGLTDNTVESDSPTKKAKKTKKIKTSEVNSKPKRINKFDSMPESKLHKEDVLIDQKLIKSPPTPRRDTFVPIKINCRVCGRTDEVDPAIIEASDRYKCNKCALAAG